MSMWCLVNIKVWFMIRYIIQSYLNNKFGWWWGKRKFFFTFDLVRNNVLYNVMQLTLFAWNNLWYIPETEICRERGSIAPRKVFARPESFCNTQTFVYYIQTLSGKSLKFLESFWIVWKVSRLSWTFLNCLESFGFVWKVSVLSIIFPYSLRKYRRPRKLPIFWQVTKLSASFQNVWKITRLSGKFP